MKYIFVGNRPNVFKKMIALKCEISRIFVVKDSYLEEELKRMRVPYEIIQNKNNLIKEIIKSDFDCLVSNGCPYILPVSKIKRNKQYFINIHPSLLPDLKGRHPINGALLFERKHGVTCHHMDDGIDTGDIISNIIIPINSKIDLGILYQLSFIAEAEVFEKAFEINFIKKDDVDKIENPLYYSRKKEDYYITKNDSLELILKKIRAFGIPSQCARFIKDGIEYKILSAKVIKNIEINNLFKDYKFGNIISIYDNNVIVTYLNNIIKFNLITVEFLEVGDSFFGFNFSEL